MARDTGQPVIVMSDESKTNFAVIGCSGQLHRGTVVIKPVYCGKKCRGCPHGHYKYVTWRENGKTRWKYAGKVGKDEACQQTQKTR